MSLATILKRVTDATELAGIRALQAANLGRHLPPDERSIRTEVTGRGAILRNLKISELKSAWK